ncbi:MAG: TIGR01212 family radical SAM protein [Bacteroidales bacterium]
MNYSWGRARRFNSYAEYLKKQFGQRVQKVSIDAGFSCPNRDGTLGYGGCTYCSNDAFNPSYCSPDKSVTQQLEEGIEFHRVRYRRVQNFLAYFQTYSNTHAPLAVLKEIYKEALKFSGVVGLVIGTRPDCIDEVKLEYFRELNRTHYVIIEYGIESVYNKTLYKINRKHTFEQAVRAIELTNEYGIKAGGHLIFGLPGESRSEMLDAASIVSKLPLTSIKFHQLQIMKNTVMAGEYQNNPTSFQFFTLEEYIDFIISFIERLTPEMIIERFTGEIPPRFHAGPNWGGIRNDQVNILIEKRMEERDTWQGKLFRACL